MTRILIAEDSPTQAEQLRMILENKGFEVDAATNGEAALAQFDRAAYDLVISDIMMPTMSGYELCTRLKQRKESRDVPVILLSTLNDPMDIIRGLECEANNFITKPYEADQLLARIQTVLQNKAARGKGKLTIGVELLFLGKKFLITSEKEQILDLLIGTFEDIVRTNRGLQESRSQLAAAKEEIERYAKDLERRVEERTKELVEQQNQLHHAQKMEAVGQLTGGLAHDFNNLLTVVIANLEDLLEKELAGRPEAIEMATAALDASWRGADLTRQLLAFSRRQQLQSQVTDLNKLVTGVTVMLRRTLGETIIIRTSLDDALWAAEADPSQLESALVNLAINARDAMPRGGQITIETGNKELDDRYAAENAEVVPGDYAMIAVTDTGTGIPAAILTKVFDPFFTTKPVGKGTGLGLSMVYGFVKQSGGHVKIYSEEGHGTTIRLYLPRARRAATAPAEVVAMDEGPMHGGTQNILVVEDNDDVRKTVVRQLKSLGYNVLEAANTVDALKILKSGEAIDLLFTDIVMPGELSSLDLVRKSREDNPRLAVLFTSGFSEASVQGNDKFNRPVNILSKPYVRHELARKIREVLGSSE